MNICNASRHKTKVKVEFTIFSASLSETEIQIINNKINENQKLNFEYVDSPIPYKPYYVISTNYMESLAISDQYVEIQKYIENIENLLCKASKEGRAEYHVCIIIVIENGITPDMMISMGMIDLLHRIRSELEFDIYANPYDTSREIV